MRRVWVLWAAAGVMALGVTAQGTTCNRVPPGITVPKTPGDNHFTIKISGDPQKYIPGEVYTVSLEGWREQYTVQKFTGFFLMMEPSQVPLDVYGPQSVGIFHLYADALTMYSDNCPNAITHTSSIPKSEVQVRWTAPPATSGCVRFRATVVESRDVWYMDDDGLTKELCEEVRESEDDQTPIISQCCACDEAKYEVTFEGLWSRQTHPKDFPNNEWLTHFSDIIGASHSSDYMVWEYGKEASDGLKEVAEWGSTRALESELKRQSDHIRTIIKARGLWHPNVNGKTFAVFRVDNHHHLMSLVSMLGPTPDWIVGVSALELCLANCTWTQHKTLNLYPYDAGTDSGVTYESVNMPTIPKGKIRRITSRYPNDPQSPFYDPTGKAMKPLARLTITRQRVYEKSCSDPTILDEEIPAFEQSDEDADRRECAVTNWSHFSPCSATCGKGLRSRTRTYLMPQKAQMSMCKRQLQENEMCAAEQLYCPGGGAFGKPTFDHRICIMSEWSSWTSCSTTCGTGQRIRNRHYLDRMGHKKCDKERVEKKMCVADEPTCDEEIISPDCAVTQWTDFSPCSKTCGEGIAMRTRSYLVAVADHSHCNIKIRDERACMGEREVCFDPDEAEEICRQEKEVGPCRGHFQRWYFDLESQSCKMFAFGGCRGNRNNFEQREDCVRLCEYNRSTLPPPPPRPSRQPDNGSVGERVNCMVTPWSPWSPCSATCGRDSFKTRRRMIKVHPQNGGRRCPKKLARRRRCKLGQCFTDDRFSGLPVLNQRRDTTTSTAPPPVPYQPEQPLDTLHGYDPDQDYISPNLYNPHPGRSHDHTRLHNSHAYSNSAPVNCVLGNWGPWSACTHSCGPESLQQRVRLVVVEPQNGGQPCGDTNQRRYCTLPPCPRARSGQYLWLEQHGP